MLFVIVKMVLPDTHELCSDMNTDMETMRTSHFEHNTTKANLHIL